MISLRFREKKREFHFSRFKNRTYYNEDEEKAEKTMAQLAAIYFGTPEVKLERSLTGYEQGPEDQEKEELDQ